MALKVKHEIDVDTDGVNFDALPEQTYIIQSPSPIGCYAAVGDPGDIDATDADFFEQDVLQKIPGIGEHNVAHPNGLVFNLAAGQRLALRANSTELGNFKQHRGAGAAATLVQAVRLEIIGEAAFELA